MFNTDLACAMYMQLLQLQVFSVNNLKRKNKLILM